MQLAPSDELVLVSGVPPIRAKKARYYEDTRLTERVLPPSQPQRKQSGGPPSDDWSQLLAPVAGIEEGSSGRGGIDDSANGGIRREPELPQHEEVLPVQTTVTPEFSFIEEDLDDDALRARALLEQARATARQAAMDPRDGIELSE
jgi:type IV secretion system protein VirD4